MTLHSDQSNEFESSDRCDLPARALRQIEQATAPAARWSMTTDAETAALRESWLALGQLLDANTPELDEAALLVNIRRQIRRQTKRRRWQHAGLALAAASLLLAVGISWHVVRSSVQPAPVNPNPSIAVSPSIEPSATSPADISTTEIDDAYWQDDLADDLAQTQRELANIQTNWARRPDPMAWMQFQLNEFEQSLGDSSL